MPQREITSVLPDQSARCEFCNALVFLKDVAGAEDVHTIDDALDLHYIEGCEMLTSCPQCDKIVEKARLSQHKTDQCEMRN